MTDRAILFSEMTPESDWEDDFNAWYDTEHIPVRMDVDGFTGAQRYRHVSGPSYLAVYDMISTDVLAGDAYRLVKEKPSDLTKKMLSSVSGFTRYIGSLISSQENPQLDTDPHDAAVLYAVFFNVPQSAHDEFSDWYTQDHVPKLLGHKDWLAVHRFLLSDSHPETFSHLALHFLANADVLQSDERAAARATEWRDRLAENSWFKGSYNVFNKQGDRFQPSA